MRMLSTLFIFFLAVVSSKVIAQDPPKKKITQYQPVIEGEWWSITGQPDLGELSSEKQQPVDFAVWQAKDGTWQLWSCIRGLNGGGKGRLFYRWETKNLKDTAWTPMGIAMQADTTLGEEKMGLQAPFVFKEKGTYYMVYGDWNNICMATSEDGKTFTRTKNISGNASLFSGPRTNTRDPMVLKVNGIFYCYYSAHNPKDDRTGQAQGSIYCRASRDLIRWSEPKVVSQGGTAQRQTQWYGGDIECPFVVHYKDAFILFRNQKYGKDYLNTQYCSDTPLDFGVDDDKYLVSQLSVAAPEIVYSGGQYYIISLKPGLDGMKMARLNFERVR